VQPKKKKNKKKKKDKTVEEGADNKPANP